MNIITDIVFKYWPVFPAVFVAGIVDAIAGGGGLITLPAYMLAGLPPHLAIGTNKMSSCMGTSIATFRLAREGYINFRLAVFAVVFALAGSYTGANISLMISNRLFKILMLFILPITAWFVLRSKNFDVEREPFSFRKTCILSCLIAFVIGVYDGFYGPATGTFLILLFTGLAGLELSEANGLTKAINLSTNLSALTVFLIHGQVIFPLGIIAGLCNIAGNYLGAARFQKNGSKIVKPVMLIVLAVFFVRLIIS
jgi:uncharacterized membrane protein YfcA